MRRGALGTVIGTVVGVLLLVFGALVGVTGCGLAGPHSTQVNSYGFSGSVAALDLDSRAGEVEVRAGSASVRVTETVHYRNSKPQLSHDLQGGTLVLRNQGCGFCSVDYVVELPANATVKVHTDAGAIRLTGLTGDVTADTTAGEIDGTGLGSAHTSVTSHAGAIKLRYQSDPSTVDAKTSAGAIEVHLPGTDSYAVDASTKAGSTTIGVPTDPAATRKITVHTSAGAITIGH